MNSITKERVISLLREGDIDGISILEQDNVTLENIIFYIRSYKLDVDEQFFRKLAKELGLPFMEREKLLEKSNLVPTLPFDIIKDQLIILMQITPESVVIATANPFNTPLLEQIELIFQLRVEVHVASSQSIEDATESGYRENHKYHALKELIDRNPDESAYRVLYKWQQKLLLVIFFWCTPSSFRTVS